jgi:AcrR family transcriptional regulator
MSSRSIRPYAGVSADARRAERRARLIETGLDLVGTEGWQATTVRAVCARARLTPRYFYENFADRDELLVAVFDQVVAEAAQATVEAYTRAPEDARAKTHAVIATFVELLTDDPRKGRVAFVEAIGSEPLMRRRMAAVGMFARIVGDHLRAFRNAPDLADPIIDHAALLLIGGLTELLIAWLGGSLDITRDQLIEDCTELFYATGDAAIRLAFERKPTATSPVRSPRSGAVPRRVRS